MKKLSNECSQDLSCNEAIDSLSKMCNKGNINNLCPFTYKRFQKTGYEFIELIRERLGLKTIWW